MRRRPGYALKSAYKWIMRYFLKDISLISSSSLNIFWSQDLSSGKEKKFNTVVRLCELDNLVAMYTIP